MKKISKLLLNTTIWIVWTFLLFAIAKPEYVNFSEAPQTFNPIAIIKWGLFDHVIVVLVGMAIIIIASCVTYTFNKLFWERYG